MDSIDLKAQYHRYQSELDRWRRQVLAHSQCIMGPEIAELEQALAACGTGPGQNPLRELQKGLTDQNCQPLNTGRLAARP
jgi:hypothetical protein